MMRGVASAMVNTSTQVGASLGAALLNTVAATATASYIASHGPRRATLWYTALRRPLP